MEEKHTCCASVYSGGYGMVHACGKNAKHERGSKWYCGTHDPVRIKEKRDAKHAEWQAKWKLDAEKRVAERNAAKDAAHKVECFVDLLEALQDLVGNGIGTESVKRAKAAIDKATKESTP